MREAELTVTRRLASMAVRIEVEDMVAEWEDKEQENGS
jgi:hypothetical protein